MNLLREKLECKEQTRAVEEQRRTPPRGTQDEPEQEPETGKEGVSLSGLWVVIRMGHCHNTYAAAHARTRK